MAGSPEESADVLTAILLFALDGFRLVLIAFVAWLIVPRHRACPQCGEPTDLVQAPRALRWLLLEKRWCLKCGWTGVARKLPKGVPAPDGESPAEAGARPRKTP